ncbi:MAG: hypothetical protein ACPF8V_11615 [Luteibaculum sp.]
MKRILCFSVFVALLFTACKKDKNKEEVANPVDAKAAMENSLQNIKGCAQTLHDGELADFFMILIEEGNADFDVDWVESLLEILEDQYFSDEFYENNEVNFSSYAGIYVWNPSSESFTKTTNSNMVQISLPTNPSNQSNLNLVGKIENYSEKTAIIDGESYKIPASLSASVTYNGTELAGIGLDELSLDNGSSTTLPVSLVASFRTAPYTHFVALSRANSKKYTVNYSLENSGACRFEVNLTGESNTDSYEDFDIEQNLVSVTGNILAGGLRYEFVVDPEGLFEDNLTAADYNQALSVNIKQNGTKIGELNAVDRNDGVEVDIVYSDGSREDFIVKSEQLLEDIEDIFSDFD